MWLLSLLLVAANASECRHSSTSLRCVEFVKNYDGDTITVNIPHVHPLLGDRITVRVEGIDTAEMKSEDVCEKQVARQAQRMIEDTLEAADQIDLVNIGRDKYFRVLATIQADGKSVGDLLVKKGLAVPYDGGTKKRVDWCKVQPLMNQ